jgi:hypothetical protein
VAVRVGGMGRSSIRSRQGWGERLAPRHIGQPRRSFAEIQPEPVITGRFVAGTDRPGKITTVGGAHREIGEPRIMPHGTLVSIIGTCLSLVLGQGDVAIHDHDHSRDPGYRGPIVHIAQRNIDVGEVREGEKATATFVVTNRGTADLVIEKVRATCGCTTIALTEDERVVKPNESQEIIAQFDSTRRMGRQRKPIILNVNDPHEPQITLTLLADVVSLFKVVPAQTIHLRSATRGTELAPLDVFPIDPAAEFEELEVQVPPGFLEYRREPILDRSHGKGVRLIFKVPEEIELGPVSGRFYLKGTIAGETAHMPLRVAGQVIGDLITRPAVLQSLHPTPRGHRFARVTVASANRRPFEILELTAGPYLDVQVQARKQKKEYGLTVTIRDDAPDGPLAATVRIRTDNSGQPVLRIPVFAQVRARYHAEPEVVLLDADTHRRRVMLRADHGFGLDITAVSCDHPAVVGQVLPADVDGLANVRFVRLGIPRNVQAPDAFTANCTVSTNIPGAAAITLPVEYTPGQTRED